jgi:3-hydroxyisobutyrate dehydrogenase-like beta-hydroxyacid dehydrogenase
METLGIIGLGLLGSALAERLVGGGWNVVGFDVREECRTRLQEVGGRAADSSGEVLAAASMVLLCLPNSQVVADVVRPCTANCQGKLLIDVTTGDPESTAHLAAWLAAHRTSYVDATVVGSSQLARQGEVVVLLGGRAEDVQSAVDVIRHFARRWFHIGPCGSGATAKLVVNLVLGLNRAALAEGLHLANRCGLDGTMMLEILRSGAAYSHVMDTKGHKMLAGEFSAEARLSQRHRTCN